MKSDLKLILQDRVDNLAAQEQERISTTFDRAAFQTSAPSDNTQHGSVRSAVLSNKRPKIGFDKTAWKPPEETAEEQPEEPAPIGFDKSAWIPPNGNTET